MKGLFELLQTASLLLLSTKEVSITPHYLFCVMKANQYESTDICGHFSDKSYFRDNSLNKDCVNFMNKRWEPESKEECSIFLEDDNLTYEDESMMLNKWSTFADYFVKFNKKYDNMDEVRERFLTYHDNLEFIRQHNEEGNHSYQLGENQFADWSNDEFKEFVRKGSFGLGMKTTCPKASDMSGTLPSAIDWREKGIVNPEAYDQSGGVNSPCGSCFTFGTTRAMEGVYAQKTGKLVHLSQQQIVDCAGLVYGDNHCNGGSLSGTYQYVIDNGITTSDAYPYTAYTGTCQSYTPLFKLSGCYEVNTNEYQVSQQLSKHVLSIAIQADGRSFQLYKSGVYDDASCYKGTLNHGVSLTGYGVDSTGKQNYRLTNSWGQDWGINGDMLIARNSVESSTVGICGLALMAGYPVL